MFNKDYKFKGWDWSEVAESLGWEYEGDNKFDQEKGEFASDTSAKEYIIKLAYRNCEANPDVVAAFRGHLTAMVEGYPDDTNTPAWQGLLNMKRDDCFVRLCIPLLGYMWN